jgi:phospholipase C
MDRRGFLRATGAVGGAALFGGMAAGCVPAHSSGGVGAEYQPTTLPTGSILDLPATEAPIDHVVILMMENRSFDHYLGWLSRDEGYLERGLSRYGAGFAVDAQSHQSYPDPAGAMVDTFHLDPTSMANPWRGCGFADPGHGWDAGHAQRDGGFLAEGSNNDRYALGYYEADDLPFHSRMARRFTTFDRYHCSELTSTQTNRRYLHSAQSGGWNNNYIPIKEGGFQFDTIWDRLRRAQVPVASYFSDLPSLAFWGFRMGPILKPIDQYFDACSAGRLPNVTFLDPPYAKWWQADDHPHADPNAGQRFLRDVFEAFVESPHWGNGMFVVTYDEWGGFFDHVAPPQLPDVLASDDDATNFGQAGFRVPTLMASPYARPGFVDHRTYDHTSIMRFLEWRFLGAPPEGPGGDLSWSLTVRDRNANNIGASLGAADPDPGVFDLGDLPLPAPTGSCEGEGWVQLPGTQLRDEGGPGLELQDLVERGFFEQVGLSSEPSSMAGTWVAG